jgi:hypothetical protein
LPKYKIDFQDALNLGDVCVNDIASNTIKITNKRYLIDWVCLVFNQIFNYFLYSSDLDTLFEWDVKEPFSVNPINGELKANESTEVTFTFHPTVILIILALLINIIF